MKRSSSFFLLAFSLSALVFGSPSMADTFGSGTNSFQIDFVTIGNPGNPPDTTGRPIQAGSVDYSYRMGKYEISEQMIDKANTLGGLGITKTMRGPNKPVTEVTWYEAAKFVNWLNTSSGHPAAYKFDGAGSFQFWQPSDPGYDAANVFRNSFSQYFLPSVNEWYKAAYFEPPSGTYFDYPTGSDTPPASVPSGVAPGTAVFLQVGPADITQAGGLSPYGTMGQGGNALEWNETNLNVNMSNMPDLFGRAIRGGDWGQFASEMSSTHGNVVGASSEFLEVGFRVVSIVPEPSMSALLAIAILGIACTRTRSCSGLE